MKKVSFMMFVAVVVLSCQALEQDLYLAFKDVKRDEKNNILKLREDIQQDILKLSLKVQQLSATNSSAEDLLKEFAGKLSLTDEFALSGKPQYQSMTVLNSTFPEIQSGTTFKSDSYGQRFYFNGYFLVMDRVILSGYIDEFGNHKKVSGFQFGLGNNPYLAENLHKAKIITAPPFQRVGQKPIKYTLFLSNELGKDVCYPLKLTNDLYSIEFSEPQPLPQKNQPLTSGDTERR